MKSLLEKLERLSQENRVYTIGGDAKARIYVRDEVRAFVSENFGATFPEDEMEVILQNAFAKLPVWDLKCLNRICFEGRMYLADAHPAEGGTFALLAKIHELAVAGLGGDKTAQLRWVPFMELLVEERRIIRLNKEALDANRAKWRRR